MTGYEFQQILSSRPFKALRLHFTEGETIEVRHPEMVWVASNMLFIGGGEIENGRVVNRELEAVYGLSHLKRIEYVGEPAERGANGS
jgi:hypothetical protein